MGFWSSLGKIGKIAAPIAASFIPGVGPIAGKLLGGAGEIAGSLAEGAAANRTEADKRSLDQDRTRVTDEISLRNAELERAKLPSDLRTNEDAQARNAYKDALKASLARNMQDVSFGPRPKGVPTMSFSGGSRPSAIGEGGRKAAEIMENQALQRLLNPEARVAMSPLERVKMSEAQKAGMMEKILGPLGMGLNVAGKFADGMGPSAKASDVVDSDLTPLANALLKPPTANFATPIVPTMKPESQE